MAGRARLVVKCCACGIEQHSMETPYDPEVVDVPTAWTRVPCPRCYRELVAEMAERTGTPVIVFTADQEE